MICGHVRTSPLGRTYVVHPERVDEPDDPNHPWPTPPADTQPLRRRIGPQSTCRRARATCHRSGRLVSRDCACAPVRRSTDARKNPSAAPTTAPRPWISRAIRSATATSRLATPAMPVARFPDARATAATEAAKPKTATEFPAPTGCIRRPHSCAAPPIRLIQTEQLTADPRYATEIGRCIRGQQSSAVGGGSGSNDQVVGRSRPAEIH